MYEAAAFCGELERLGAGFFTGVPDTVLTHLCNYLVEHPPRGGHVIAANEGGAVGLAAGRYLAGGKIPVVYMQNSGIGNAVNPLLSLADREVYAIPMLLLVGWRGEPGRRDEPQHMKQGRVSQALFESMGIPHGVLGPDFPAAKAELERAFACMAESPGPYSLLVRNGCFAPGPAVSAGHPEAGLKREQAIRAVVQAAGPEAALVASTGMGSRELFEIRERLGQGHGRDFLNAGAMGHAAMIAAGAALARPDRRVICLDGDGAALMHMGAMAIMPGLQCRNLVHVLLNNGVHDSVGGQPIPSGELDFAGLALACGYPAVHQTDNEEDLLRIVRTAGPEEGPVFVEVRLARGFRSDLGRPTVPFPEAARQFRAFMKS